jgi:uncharacterized membrane protein YeaQ/YmgE (transglycosylase-associated protein family)
MSIFAGFAVEPRGVVAWLAVGLAVGLLAGRLLRGRGFGVAGDVAAALAGSAAGSLLCEWFTSGTSGFMAGVVIALAGACLAVAVVRVFAPRRDQP